MQNFVFSIADLENELLDHRPTHLCPYVKRTIKMCVTVRTGSYQRLWASDEFTQVFFHAKMIESMLSIYLKCVF